MKRAYNLFEKLPDGSTLWHACIIGRFEANRRLQEFAEHSENDFFLIEIPGEDFLRKISAPKSMRPMTKIAAVE